MANTPRFEEIAEHPAFTQTYQGGLRAHLQRLRDELETSNVSNPIHFARLQERVNFCKWVLEQYPLVLTRGPAGGQHSSYGEEEDTSYEANAENPAFAD